MDVSELSDDDMWRVNAIINTIESSSVSKDKSQIDEILKVLQKIDVNVRRFSGSISTPQHQSSFKTYTSILMKLLTISSNVVSKIPYLGFMSPVLNQVVNIITLATRTYPDIKAIVSDTLRNIFDDEKINQAGGITTRLSFAFTALQRIRDQSSAENVSAALVVQVRESSFSAFHFIGMLQADIINNRNPSDQNMTISNAERLIMLIEVYCHLNCKVLLYTAAFQAYPPCSTDEFKAYFEKQRTIFKDTIQFLSEDNPIVSCYYPEKHFIVTHSLAFFELKIQNVDEILNKVHVIKDNEGNRVSKSNWLDRLSSDKGNSLAVRCLFEFHKKGEDNIFEMGVILRETFCHNSAPLFCDFRSDKIKINRQVADRSECRITRVNPGHYIISNCLTRKPYRMKNPPGNIITPSPQEDCFSNRTFFRFEQIATKKEFVC